MRDGNEDHLKEKLDRLLMEYGRRKNQYGKKQEKNMKLHLTFEEKDFENLRAFDKAVKRQLGSNVYTGSDSLCFYFDYPKELVSKLRPFGDKTSQLEFDLDSSLPDEKKSK